MTCHWLAHSANSSTCLNFLDNMEEVICLVMNFLYPSCMVPDFPAWEPRSGSFRTCQSKALLLNLRAQSREPGYLRTNEWALLGAGHLNCLSLLLIKRGQSIHWFNKYLICQHCSVCKGQSSYSPQFTVSWIQTATIWEIQSVISK